MDIVDIVDVLKAAGICGAVFGFVLLLMHFARKKNDEEAEEEKAAFTEQQFSAPSLYSCPDCGNMVSIYATSCPQCGRPLVPQGPIPDTDREAPQRSGASVIGIIFAVVVGILVAIWVASKIFHVEVTGTIVPIK